MYKLIKSRIDGEIRCVFRQSDNTTIPMSEDNTDYQQYLKWLEEGNQALPAEEQQ